MVVRILIPPNLAVLLENAFDELSGALMSHDTRVKACRLMLSDRLARHNSAEYFVVITFDTMVSSEIAHMNSKAWTGNSVIFIIWDESDLTGSGPFGFGDTSGCCDAPTGDGGGRVVMITISHSDHTSRFSNVNYNHYSMLGTIEDGWGLGCLAFTCDTENVPRMTDLVGPQK